MYKDYDTSILKEKQVLLCTQAVTELDESV